MPDLRPNQRTDHVGAVTKHSALALLAKVYLYNGDYENVLASTNEIINSGKFNLHADYYNLFKIPGKLSNESLYEFQYTDFGTASGDIVQSDNWFTFQGPAGQNKPSTVSGWSFIAPTQNLRDFFAARGEDVRAKTTFLVAGSTTPSGDIIGPAPEGMPACYNGKAYTPSSQLTSGRTTYGANNNIRILRYADVLLMNAEAKIRLGQNGDAPLNLVRARAGLPAITGATLQNVLDERRAELAIEWGERFFDLVRTDQAQTLLPGFTKGKSEFYPIPQRQKDLNPNL
ncbi:SusD family protein [compost metagenome]